MKILFWGQLGLTERIEALGKELVAGGHEVIATTAMGSDVKNVRGIQMRYRPSLNPEKPGGWFYILMSLLTLWKQKPQVAHVHGWRAAALIRLAIILSPETTYVLTIDDENIARWVVRQAAGVLDAITVPTRQVQSWLLHACGVRAQYVPDGYEPMGAATLKLTRWNLRAGQYVLTVGGTAAEIRAIGKRGVRVLEKLATTERAQRSLIGGAALVVLGSKATVREALWAMAAGKALLAAPTPVLQETLGVAAPFEKLTRQREVRACIRDLKARPGQRRTLGLKAQKRAEAHFTWERVALDYVTVYQHYVAQPVMMDSAHEPMFTQPVVQ